MVDCVVVYFSEERAIANSELTVSITHPKFQSPIAWGNVFGGDFSPPGDRPADMKYVGTFISNGDGTVDFLPANQGYVRYDNVSFDGNNIPQAVSDLKMPKCGHKSIKFKSPKPTAG